jgi:ABC-type dipeptide/oligopeptide/nickel transport system permease subunit
MGGEVDLRGLEVILLLPFLYGGLLGLLIGFFCGVVMSLVVGIRKTFSFVPQVSLIVSCVFGFIPMLWERSFTCLHPSRFDNCQNIIHFSLPSYKLRAL